MSYRTMRRTAWRRVAWSHPWLVLVVAPAATLAGAVLVLVWMYTSVPHPALAAVCSVAAVGVGGWTVWQRPPLLRAVLLFGAAVAFAAAGVVLAKGI